ncbi:hypothetical protein Bbelb_373720 [Branchiostoma belcheri]|nr:hypothetical protein Bbelb_373720 [Branchiostoma belcheri]
MDEDLSLNAIPMVVRNDILSESLAEKVSPNLKQADEDAESNISGKCEESEHGEDDEQQSIKNDAAFEIETRQTISPGDFDTYAIAYICSGHYICAERSVEKANGKPCQGTNSQLATCVSDNNETDTSAFKGSDSSMHTQARDPNPTYTHNNMNPYPMDAKNDVNPNPMYLQSTIESNASFGPTRDPNPIYPHNTINPYPMDVRNDVNPKPMYLQTPVEPPNASPESTIRPYENDDIPCTQASADVHQQGDGANFRPANNDDNHCLQPYAVTHLQDGEANSSPANNDDNHGLQPYAVTHLQDGEANSSPANNDGNHCLQPYAVTDLQDEEAAAKASITSDDESIKPDATAYMCQDDMVCSTASGDDRTTPPLQNQPSAASNNIHDILNGLNPNPMYLPNVQHCPTCVQPRRLSLALLYAAVVLGSCISCGVFLWLRFDASPPPLNTTYGGIVTPVPTMLDAAGLSPRSSTLVHAKLLEQSPAMCGSWGVGVEITMSFSTVRAASPAYRIGLMYSHSGDKIFDIGIGANRLPHYRGVCLDTLGRIIVANNGGNRIDMFTSRGEFLRTIAHVENPWGVAVGPNGDLVVTRAVSYKSTVTIFPCHLVLS